MRPMLSVPPPLLLLLLPLVAAASARLPPTSGADGASGNVNSTFNSTATLFSHGLNTSTFYYRGTQSPLFVVEQVVDGGIELRSYPAAQWTSTNVSGFKYKKALSTGFERLFAYISGANVDQLTINMTAPVRVLATPGDGPFCEDHFKISFFVPFALQGKAPLPTSDNVFLDSSPAQRVFVSSYPGFTSEELLIQEARDTVVLLDQAGLWGKYNASYFFSAGYDSPFQLQDRHNEVWIPAV